MEIKFVTNGEKRLLSAVPRDAIPRFLLPTDTRLGIDLSWYWVIYCEVDDDNRSVPRAIQRESPGKIIVYRLLKAEVTRSSGILAPLDLDTTHVKFYEAPGEVTGNSMRSSGNYVVGQILRERRRLRNRRY